MKEQFQFKNFHAKTLRLINQANAIITDMKAQGYTLTLRQLYYRLVESKVIPNTTQSYDRLGSVIDDARKCGLIDWNAIEDRTRFLRKITDYKGPQDFLTKFLRYYAEDLWRDQAHYCEVWIEKDALIGVVERPCNEWRVPHFACRGYPSSSELYIAAKRLHRKVDAGKTVTVFYLGDHDPSGLDMDRSNGDLLSLFAHDNGIEVRRLGLTFEQTAEYNLVPDPAKQSDVRFAAYAEQFGDESWELDALRPQVIDQLIRDAIKSVVDEDDFNAKLEQEEVNQAKLEAMRDNVDAIARYLKYRYTEHLYRDEIMLSADEVLDDVEGDDDVENS
jgi:hypothetical protein